MISETPYVLPNQPDVDRGLSVAIHEDYRRFATSGLPPDLDEFLADRYRLDLRTNYAGYELPNPWGKASGQLSMTAEQVKEDVAAGLSFIVLKTVIAEDENGERSMGEWAVKESRMLAERIVGQSGERGWTISWKGRGWWQSFDDYLQLVRDARQIASAGRTLIVPSCKYHLPTPAEVNWILSEYDYTTSRLLAAWRAGSPESTVPMPLEKDFSPTLAGSEHATARNRILEWLRRVPQLVAASVAKLQASAERTSLSEPVCDRPHVRLGLKLFNALFDDTFQLEMLRTIHEDGPGRPDYFVYGNRLFDSRRSFDGHKGIAYGGPDLSDRNLRVMSQFQEEMASHEECTPLLPWSATGNITTGKMAMEYALRGASSFQLHTFFQLPAEVFSMKVGSKTQKALHELHFHPETGLIVWLHHIAGTLGLSTDPIRFRECIGRGRDLQMVR